MSPKSQTRDVGLIVPMTTLTKTTDADHECDDLEDYLSGPRRQYRISSASLAEGIAVTTKRQNLESGHVACNTKHLMSSNVHKQKCVKRLLQTEAIFTNNKM